MLAPIVGKDLKQFFFLIWKEIGVSSQNKLENKEINEKQNKNFGLEMHFNT